MVAVGRVMKGETVRGIWASRGWGSVWRVSFFLGSWSVGWAMLRTTVLHCEGSCSMRNDCR